MCFPWLWLSRSKSEKKSPEQKSKRIQTPHVHALPIVVRPLTPCHARSGVRKAHDWHALPLICIPCARYLSAAARWHARRRMCRLAAIWLVAAAVIAYPEVMIGIRIPPPRSGFLAVPVTQRSYADICYLFHLSIYLSIYLNSASTPYLAHHHNFHRRRRRSYLIIDHSIFLRQSGGVRPRPERGRI
ncbi:hypothetical protein BZA70DRAFT_198075 [Myxozyma melibiosi]|uniref:Uncharacterized protein n=1 Tax=Myxozyma melibiosi TaxID=54550 RepID=A0ABR1F2D9_9ASCO